MDPRLVALVEKLMTEGLTEREDREMRKLNHNWRRFCMGLI